MTMTAPMTATELVVGGMTCASCAARIERKLNKLDGVTASVNLATETAWVKYPAQVTIGTLITVIEQAGYSAAVLAPHAEPEAARSQAARSQAAGPGATESWATAAGPASLLWRRVVAAGTGFVVIMVVGMVPALQFPGWGWAALAVATPVVTWGAWPFHRAAVINARHAAATMDTLVSLGVTVSYLWSVYALVSGSGAAYLEVASAITALVLVGRHLESRARRRAGDALKALLELGAKDAAVLRDGVEARVRASGLTVGDLIVVRPGEKIATDGVVIDGHGAVDASMITGEPVPVEVAPGDPVTGGCVNAGGRLVVRATRVGHDTQLAQIARLVTRAQAGKAPAQRLADRVCAVFVPAVLLLAAATATGWLAIGHDVRSAISAAVAVLVIACPCAMGLATPTALLVGTGRGAQLGILIKGPEILEATRQIDTVILDKTGTVTAGRMTLLDVLPAPGVTEAELLRLAGAVEDASEHPIGRAIVAGARDRLGPVQWPVVTNFLNEPGLGVTGQVTDHEASVGTGAGASTVVSIGRTSWLAAHHGFAGPGVLAGVPEQADAAGQTVVFAAWDGAVRGAFIVADAVKPSSGAAVARLRAMGLRILLLTGDNERVARSVAQSVGIDPGDVISGVLPAGKVDVIKALQDTGRVVAMAGDGVNDAAALAQADLGLAMGTGTDAAIEASDLTLVRGDLLAVPDAIELSRRTLATIKGNLAWAFGYNILVIPFAALGLLSPMIAAAAMAFSSVFVVTNSLRLRRFTPR
jgi:P-type Cu+ transporter